MKSTARIETMARQEAAQLVMMERQQKSEEEAQQARIVEEAVRLEEKRERAKLFAEAREREVKRLRETGVEIPNPDDDSEPHVSRFPTPSPEEWERFHDELTSGKLSGELASIRVKLADIEKRELARLRSAPEEAQPAPQPAGPTEPGERFLYAIGTAFPSQQGQ